MQYSKNDRLIIIGASGHGKVIADIAMKMNLWDRFFFLDDNEDLKNSLGINVIGKVSDAEKYINGYDFFVAIGSNASREKVQNRMIEAGAFIATLIHPDSVIGQQVEIGKGTAVMAGVVINCCTQIGQGCIINTGATIDHDNKIGDFVHISPGVNTAGTVAIGEKTWLGIGTKVSNNITITKECIFGAGAVVIEDITKPGTYVGVPARRINK